MRSNRYIHPEFGFLAPTSRLRRELRVGLFSMLFGIGVGAAAVAALRVDSRDRHSGSVSPVETGGAVATPSADTQVPPDGGGYKRLEAANVNIDGPTTEIEVQTGNAGKSNESAGGIVNAERAAAKSPRRTVRAASDVPSIARLPLGRSDAFTGMVPSEAQPDVAPRGPLASGAPKLPPESTQSRTSPQGKSAAERLTSPPLPRKKPEKTVRDEAGRDGRLGQAYARDSSSSPKGFWSWSW